MQACQWSAMLVDLWNHQKWCPLFLCMLGRSCGECKIYINLPYCLAIFMEKHHDPISRQLTSLDPQFWTTLRVIFPLAPGMLFGTSGWRHVGLHRHRGSEMWSSGHLPTGHWQRERPGTTRTGSWSPRGQGATGAQNLQNHPQPVIVHERQPGWALSRPQMWRWFGWVRRLGAMMCNVCWIVQGLPGFTEWRFKMTPRFVSGDGVPWLLPFGIHLAILGRTWKKKSEVASPVF